MAPAKGTKQPARGMVVSVRDEVRTWDSPQGQTIHYIEGEMHLEGHDSNPVEWSVGTIEKYVVETKARMHGLIDTMGDFEVEWKDEYRGIDQVKLLNYPGKPQSSFNSGGSGGGDGNRPSGGKGDWETAPERGYRQQAVLYESMMKSIAPVVAELSISTVNALIEATDQAFEAAVAKLGAYPAAPAPTPAPATAPAPATPVQPSLGVTPAATNGGGDRNELINALLAHWGRPSRIKAEWEEAGFGEDAPEPQNMSIRELEALIERAAAQTT